MTSFAGNTQRRMPGFFQGGFMPNTRPQPNYPQAGGGEGGQGGEGGVQYGSWDYQMPWQQDLSSMSDAWNRGPQNRGLPGQSAAPQQSRAGQSGQGTVINFNIPGGQQGQQGQQGMNQGLPGAQSQSRMMSPTGAWNPYSGGMDRSGAQGQGYGYGQQPGGQMGQGGQGGQQAVYMPPAPDVNPMGPFESSVYSQIINALMNDNPAAFGGWASSAGPWSPGSRDLHLSQQRNYGGYGPRNNVSGGRATGFEDRGAFPERFDPYSGLQWRYA